MPGVFVDREAESARLVEFVDRAAQDGPRLLVVHGVAGVGKTALLTAFAEQVRSTKPVRARSVVAVRCHGQVGAENAYGVMLDALKELRPSARRGRLLKLGGRIAVDSGAEIIAGVVPAAGPALRAGIAAAGKAHSGDRAVVAPPVPRMIADAIFNELRPMEPSVLLIDDAHLIDASSCLVLDRLVARSADRPLAIILAMRSGELDPGEPLRELLDRLTIRGSATSLSLTGFDPATVDTFVRARYGAELDVDQTAKLHRHTGGHPIFVAQYLSMLRERPGEQAPGEEVPTSAEAVIRQRIQRLAPADLELLSFAAIQGERFIATTVQVLSGLPRTEILDRLYEISLRSGLIQLGWTDELARRVGADVYEFEHALVRQALYVRQSPQLRRERHAAVAAVLADLMRDWPAPQMYLLEVIRQHHLGCEYVPAAQKALAMSRSLVASGGSLVEAERLCRQALDDVRQAGEQPEMDRLRVEIIELLLLTTERRWSTSPEFLATTPLEQLAEEADMAANRSGDVRLRVRAAALRGRVLHKVRGVDSSLEALSQAVRLAAESNDATMTFLTQSAYGRELTKRDLHAGLGVLLDAQRLADEHDDVGHSRDPALLHALARTEMQIGISLFDSGDLGAAQTRLDRSVQRLRDEGDVGTMPTALNYLAQVQCAVGLWEKAGVTLREAVALGEAEPSAWHAYNVALLGKLHLELGDLDSAMPALAAAWQETRQTMLVNVATLVCNLYVEGLIHALPAGSEDAVRVHDLLTWNIERCRQASLPRSEVVGLSLLTRLCLVRGDVEGATRAGELAVRILDERGPLPAVQSEAVLHQHSVALAHAGRMAEAEQARARARRVVDAKAATLPADLRRCFLTRVRLNVELLG